MFWLKNCPVLYVIWRSWSSLWNTCEPFILKRKLRPVFVLSRSIIITITLLVTYSQRNVSRTNEPATDNTTRNRTEENESGQPGWKLQKGEGKKGGNLNYFASKLQKLNQYRVYSNVLWNKTFLFHRKTMFVWKPGWSRCRTDWVISSTRIWGYSNYLMRRNSLGENQIPETNYQPHY